MPLSQPASPQQTAPDQLLKAHSSWRKARRPETVTLLFMLISLENIYVLLHPWMLWITYMERWSEPSRWLAGQIICLIVPCCWVKTEGLHRKDQYRKTSSVANGNQWVHCLHFRKDFQSDGGILVDCHDTGFINEPLFAWQETFHRNCDFRKCARIEPIKTWVYILK